MKKGDTLPVKVEGITVTQAVVEAVEADRVTLLIPGTRAVVGIRLSLTDENTTTPEKETIIDGVQQPEAQAITEVSDTTDTADAAPTPTAATETTETAATDGGTE